MLTFYAEYIERLQALHTDIAKAIDGLPPQALDWVPGPEMNSIAVLLVHLCGAERYWIGDVAGGEISGRDRAVEFRTSGLDLDDLKARLVAADEYARGVLERLSLDDLDVVRASPRDGRQFSVAWALLHALEHTALHLGHLQLARQMWQERQKAA